VQHGASGRSATFGELAADSAKVALAAEPAITTPDQFKLIGQEVERIDTTLKCTGAARFGIDTLPRRSRPGRRGCGELGLASSPDESP
jgi:isoquinoline 1-oxidoreductase subunit beta